MRSKLGLLFAMAATIGAFPPSLQRQGMSNSKLKPDTGEALLEKIKKENLRRQELEQETIQKAKERHARRTAQRNLQRQHAANAKNAIKRLK
jgi:hypothetical protein